MRYTAPPDPLRSPESLTYSVPLSGSAVMSLRNSGVMGKAFAGTKMSVCRVMISTRMTFVLSAMNSHFPKNVIPFGSSRSVTNGVAFPLAMTTTEPSPSTPNSPIWDT